MPRVPEYGGFQVMPTIAPGQTVRGIDPNVTAQSARNTRDALAGSDAAIRASSQVALDFANEANGLRVKEALNKLRAEEQRLTYDKAEGYTTILGGNALNRGDKGSLDQEYGQKLKTYGDKVRAALGNDAQRKLFDESSSSVYTQFGSGIQRHLTKQYFAYSDAVRKEEANTFAQAAILSDDPEVIAKVNERFEEVCDIFLDALKKKYCITINEDWRASHPNSLASLTLALYSFFVLDHQDNVEEFLYNYIIQHYKELYENFESLKSKKDASTLSNRKSYSVELTVIFSNIFDVCMYILDHATPFTFFDNISKDYVPASIISNMYESGDLGGIYDDDLPVDGRDFSDCIAEMFRENTSYKSTICFEVMNRLRRWAEQSDSE